jgi:nitric-oxide synthase
MTDHHTESRLFLTHVERELRAGRPAPADWTWIVPPISGALTPVFHQYYTEADLRPNFYLDEQAQAHITGPANAAGVCPVAHAAHTSEAVAHTQEVDVPQQRRGIRGMLDRRRV